MVDWQDSGNILNEFDASNKLAHFVAGVFLWEFACSLGFDHSLLRGSRPWRWTAALYIACRICSICHVTIIFADLSSPNQFHCKSWLIVSFFFRCITTSIALSLYALRTIAVYQRSVFVAIITFVAILANVIVLIVRVPQMYAAWESKEQACLELHTHAELINNSVFLGSELFLLLLMAGCIYMHNSGHYAFKIMYREGLLWLTFAALMQTATVVCFALNLNPAMNGLFLIPAGIFTTIGAMRMYRTITDTQPGDLLDFLETSRNEATGSIRFRRKAWPLTRKECQSSASATTTALQMTRLPPPTPQPEGRFVERFEASDIEFDDESESMGNGNRSIVTEDDKSGTEYVHAM